MKYLLLIIIKAYWFIIPASKRNKCLFKVSCSNYVFNTTKNKGFFDGIKAFFERFKNCRPGYQIINIENQAYMISANQELIHEKHFSNIILKDL